ncbi:MAG: hypothetical protein H5T73_02890 [Actinobacteria bacterium]|nr:hypothetical protein [Actinomycetota bacterium]
MEGGVDMSGEVKRIEFFIPAPACACSGAAFLRDTEKLSRLEMFMDAVTEKYPSAEIIRYAMEQYEAYAEGLRRLAAYLREAGEEDFASRIAFSLRYVLPAVAVDGKLVANGRVPDMEDVVQALQAGEVGPER